MDCPYCGHENDFDPDSLFDDPDDGDCESVRCSECFKLFDVEADVEKIIDYRVHSLPENEANQGIEEFQREIDLREWRRVYCLPGLLPLIEMEVAS